MISTYAWVSGGELPSQRLRSYTFGLAAAIGFLGAVSYIPWKLFERLSTGINNLYTVAMHVHCSIFH